MTNVEAKLASKTRTNRDLSVRWNNLSSQFHHSLKEKQITVPTAIESPVSYDMRHKKKETDSSHSLQVEVKPSWETLQSNTIIHSSQTPQLFHIDKEHPIVLTPPDNHIHHKAPPIRNMFFKLSSFTNTSFQTSWPAWWVIDQLSETDSSRPTPWPFVPGISRSPGTIKNIFSLLLCFVSVFLFQTSNFVPCTQTRWYTPPELAGVRSWPSVNAVKRKI